MHPMMAARMDFWRLSNFELERLPSAPEVHLFRAVGAREPARRAARRPGRGARPVAGARRAGTITAIPQLERTVRQAFESMRSVQSGRRPRERLLWNRLLLYVWPVMDFGPEDAGAIIERFTRITAELGIELVMVRGRVMEHGFERERVLRLFNPAGRGVTVEVTDPPTQPLQPLDEGAQRIISARRRGTLHPAEIVKLLDPDGFVEHDLDDEGDLMPVDRPAATNRASIVVGLIRNRTREHPEGMLRVILLGDPTRSLGSLAEPECRRIIAALDLAEELGVPVEWFAVSSGAKIAMDSGTENMDWVAAVAAPDRALHAGGRRDQRDRQRHQRRRAAVLQRRGDDAHAHARHPRDDAGERDGADRQAGARLLGRHLGRGQLRHRRLRADHGAERPGAVLGARPGRAPASCCCATTSTPTWRPASASRAAPRAATRSTATCARRRTTRRTRTWRRSATCSPRRPTPGARRPSTSAR